MRVAFLGPDGTHSGEAVRSCPLFSGCETVPVSRIRGAFTHLVSGEVDAAVLPIENSLEGSVGETLDMLAGSDGGKVKIQREIVRPVAHALLRRAGRAGPPTAILSHPQALAQCAESLARAFPGLKTVPTSSTAEAARQVSDEDAALLALAPREVAARFGLEIMADDLSDEPGNRTRFIALMKEDARSSGADRTSIVFGLDRDRPGGLHDALGEFAVRSINLSRIESRPTRRALGEYRFFVDFEAHREDPAAAEALEALARKAAFFRMLGSYPRAS